MFKGSSLWNPDKVTLVLFSLFFVFHWWSALVLTMLITSTLFQPLSIFMTTCLYQVKLAQSIFFLFIP